MVVSKFNGPTRGPSWLGHGAGRLGLFGDGAGEVAWSGSDAIGMAFHGRFHEISKAFLQPTQ